jgi:hypothetical protein
MSNQSRRLFSGRHFSEIEQIQITQLETKIKSEEEDFILNVNEDEYIDQQHSLACQKPKQLFARESRLAQQ